MSFSYRHPKNQFSMPALKQDNEAQSFQPDHLGFSDNSPAYAAYLQRAIGNQGVMQLMKSAYTSFRPPADAGSTVRRKPNQTGIPDRLKERLESLSGMDLSDVRVHYNSDKPARLQARAYTQGNEIHLGPGQEQYLPHEVWHTVQQKQGRVSPTGWINGQAVNEDKALEHEAESMASASSKSQPPFSLPPSPAGNAPAAPITSNSPIQMIKVTKDDIGQKFIFIAKAEKDEINIHEDKTVNHPLYNQYEGILKEIKMDDKKDGGEKSAEAGDGGKIDDSTSEEDDKTTYVFQVGGKTKQVKGSANILSRSIPDEKKQELKKEIFKNIGNKGESEEEIEKKLIQVEDLADRFQVSIKDVLKCIRECYLEQPGTYYVKFPFSPVTIQQSFFGGTTFTTPDENTKKTGKQVYVQSSTDRFSKLQNRNLNLKKPGKYRKFENMVEPLSPTEEPEENKQEFARKVSRLLSTKEKVDMSSLTAKQQYVLGIFLAVLFIADPNRIDSEHESVEREILVFLHERAKGKTTFHEAFGDPERSLYFGARKGGTENERTMIYEVMMANLLGNNDHLINAICRAEYKRNASLEELVAIVSLTIYDDKKNIVTPENASEQQKKEVKKEIKELVHKGIETIKTPSDPTIEIITEVLGIDKKIVVRSGEKSQPYGNGNEKIYIEKIEEGKFRPDPNPTNEKDSKEDMGKKTDPEMPKSDENKQKKDETQDKRLTTPSRKKRDRKKDLDTESSDSELDTDPEIRKPVKKKQKKDETKNTQRTAPSR